MKKNFFLSILVGGTVFSAPLYISNVAFGEFRCQAEIHYRWKPTDKPIDNKPIKTPAPAAKGVVDAKQTPVATVLPEDGIREVFSSTAIGSGLLEDDAKNALKAVVTEERAKADASCRETHENQSKCLGVKYSQNATTMQLLSFSQRKEFEKKMVEDCQQAGGQCLGSAATEPVCSESKKAEPTAAPDAKGKDAKKK